MTAALAFNITDDLTLESFRKEMTWDHPPQGLFSVEIGLADVKNQDLMLFADINADKYTDLVTLDSDSKTLISVYTF